VGLVNTRSTGDLNWKLDVAVLSVQLHVSARTVSNWFACRIKPMYWLGAALAVRIAVPGLALKSRRHRVAPTLACRKRVGSGQDCGERVLVSPGWIL